MKNFNYGKYYSIKKALMAKHPQWTEKGCAIKAKQIVLGKMPANNAEANK